MDAFDPVAYLAEKKAAGGFDPAAYLAEKGVKAAPPAPEDPGNPVANKMRSILGMDPNSRFSMSHALGLDQEDTFQPKAPAPDLAHGPTMQHPTPWSPREQKLREDAGPFADDWGAQGVVGHLAGGAAGKLISKAAGPILGRVFGGAGETATKTVAAATEGGVGAKTQGGDALPGAAVGAGLSMLGPLGRAVMTSRGGMARSLIEEHGGQAGVLSPGKGKPFDEMVTRETSDSGIGQQAAASAEKGLGMLNQEKKGVLGVLGRRIGALDESAAGKAPRDVSNLIPQLQEALGEINLSDVSEARLLSALRKIEGKQKPGFNADVDPYVLSEADLNKTRRRLDKAARTGESTDAQLGPLKQAAHDARGMVDEGPYADVNARYSKESKNYQQSRRLLGINERPKTPDETKAAVEKVTNLITRRGQNTVTAGKGEQGTQANLKAFEEKHPDIGDELAKPGMLRAKGDLEFGVLPRKHGGLIDRTSGAIGTGAALDAAATMAGHGHGVGGASPVMTSAAAMAAYLMMRNLPAIEGRLLYTPAKLAAMNEPELIKLIPLLNAARNAAGDNQ